MVAAQIAPAPAPTSSLPQAANGGTRGVVWSALALAGANAWTYAPTLKFGFLGYDDPQYVTDNPMVKGGLNSASFLWACTTGYFSYWHPLTWLSHMLDVQLYGLDGSGHHLTNLILHTAATIVVFLVLRSATRETGRSFVVAALFALHPLHVQTVAWIAERKGILSALFWFLTIGAYVAYVRKPGVLRYLLLAGAFLCGLMSKPIVVTLPVVLLLMDVWPLRRLPSPAGSVLRRVWPLILEKVPLFALAAACSWLTIANVSQQGNFIPPKDMGLQIPVLYSALSYWAYVGKSLYPAGLSAFYPFPRTLYGWHGVAAAMGLAAVSLATLRELERRPYLAAGWFWYLVSMLPVIGLVQSEGQTMADRYAYIPIVGLFVMAAWSFPDSPAWRRRGAALAALVILACAARSRIETSYWRGDIPLWSRAIEVTKDNFLALNNIGSALLDVDRLDEAQAYLENAVRAKSTYAMALSNLGVVHARKGETARAIELYRESIRYSPDYAEAHSNLGAMLAAVGERKEAKEHYRIALKQKPNFANAHLNLAVLLEQEGRSGEAVAEAVEAVRLEPNYAAAHENLGGLLAKMGRVEESIRHLETAKRLNSRSKDSAELLAHLKSARGGARPKEDPALARATRGGVLLQLGRIDEAIVELTAALKLDPRSAETHTNLGVALAGRGKDELALKHFREALQLNPRFSNGHLNLAVFMAGKGEKAAALKHAKEALAYDPANESARAMVEQLSR